MEHLVRAGITFISIIVIWILFLNIIGYDVLRMIVTQAICEGCGSTTNTFWNTLYYGDGTFPGFYKLYSEGLLPEWIMLATDQIYSKYPTVDDITTSVNTESDNSKRMKIIGWVTLSLIIVSGAILLGWVIVRYKLPMRSILIRGFVVFFLMALLDIGFFTSVAVQYIPWDLRELYTYAVQCVL